MTPRTDHVLDHVDDYLHDLLDEQGAAHVVRHCAQCATCASAMEEARRRQTALQSVPPSEASGRLVRATIAGIDRYEGRRRWRRRTVLGGLVAVLTTAAAIIITFQIHYANLSVSPIDLKVLGQTQLLAGASGSLRIFLVNHHNGAAMGGVPVRIGLRQRDTGQTVDLAQITTDADGTGQPRFQVPDWADAECDLQITADSSPGQSVVYPVKVHRSWQVMLSSDKPVYQPGQTIHVRSLALRRPDLRPVAGEETMFTITDPKGNVIFKRQTKTSDYGITSADCPLADEIFEGQYVIACTVGNTPSRLAVDVRKYVLPKFKLGVTFDRTYYTPGEQVTATIEAAYFFGKPVAGATVEAEATLPERGMKPFHMVGARTDAAGKATFSFGVPQALGASGPEGDQRRMGGPGRAPAQPDIQTRLVVRATVTDAAGQKQVRESAAVVATSPLRIEIIPENGLLVPGLLNKVYVLTTYADGRPARTRVTGVGPRGDEAIRTDALGVAEVSFLTNGDGLDTTVTAEDDTGLRANTRVQLNAEQLAQDFLLRTDKAVYDGGDTMTVTILGGGLPRPVFVDLIKDGQTLLTEAEPANGQGVLQIDLPPEASGTLQLCAYRMNLDGVQLSKTRTLFVRPAQGLRIKATPDRAEYRPGRTAKVRFELLDKAGKPARGALSLAAVDEAVFSVLQQAPGSEGQVFGLDQDLLRPVQAVYPWSPDMPAAGRDRLEQALFARTVRTTSESLQASAWGATGGRNWRGADEPLSSHQASPYTLATSSFVAESQRVENLRHQGMNRIVAAWLVLGVCLALLFYALMWVYIRVWRVIEVVHILLGAVVVLGLTVIFLVPNFKMRATLPGDVVAMREDVPRTAGAAPPLPQQSNDKGPNHGGSRAGSSPEPIRVREEFPETLLWRPQLITDDSGRADLDIDLADSITTWRLTASAVTTDGRLGAAQTGLKVFQPFFVDLNLPVSLTRGDEIAVPVVVYSYLDKPQTVELSLAASDWFEPLDAAARKIELGPREVRSLSYRLRVKKVGKHALEVTAKGGDLADAIKRTIDVVPDGRRVEEVTNGSLAQPADITLTVPDNAIEGSAKLFVKLYPSSFSQLVEGLDGIFQMPYGCFEQTSSTTYPNVLALDYLHQTDQAASDVRARAEHYIQLGYQRLLSFEVSGGGFDWFGHPPANRTLTAYGLMEFQDMARVYPVDPRLIERTRTWLLKQRSADGSWAAESHRMHGDAARGQGADMAKLSATAYIAWAVFGGAGTTNDIGATAQYLLAHRPESIDDPYILALIANALQAMDTGGRDAMPYLERLDSLKKEADGGRFYYWEQPANSRTAFYGAGRSGSVETTAVATLALLHRNDYPETIRRGLAWLVKQRDARGTWPSTQATVLALKALITSTGKPAGDGERRFTIAWGGQQQHIIIPADQAEVMKQIDLSAGLKPGSHQLTMTETSGTAAGYQVAFRYHIPEGERPEKREPFAVQITYDRSQVRVDDTVPATARVTNRRAQAAPMVILDLPIPAGCTVEADSLSALLKDKRIEKYQVAGQSLVVYLRELDAGQSLELKYSVRATMPVKAVIRPARAYEYYDPDKQGTSAAAHFTVLPRP
jgi:hypothetical protein